MNYHTSKEVAIKVEGVYKKFCLNLKRSMAYGVFDMARSMVGMTSNGKRLRPGEFWALQDVSFELRKGATLGIMGENGSGKTTLLRLLSGIFTPDSGRITVDGKVSTLIAVGAGFHPHMTGRENIYLNGIILGMTRREIKKKFDEIVDFAEIDEFIDAPVSTYSSGMYVRLGFAIAIHSRPDIILADEILAVGDYAFHMKCFAKLLDLLKGGCSVVLVSHNEMTIRSVCKEVAILRKGRFVEAGSTDDMICKHRSILLRDSILRDSIGKKEQKEKIQEREPSLLTRKVGLATIGGASIRSIEIRDGNNELVRRNHEEFKKIRYSKKNRIVVSLDVDITETLDHPRISFDVRDVARAEYIYVCGACISSVNDDRISVLRKGQKHISCELDIGSLAPGLYYLLVTIGDDNYHWKTYERITEADRITFEIAFSEELIQVDALLNRPYFLPEYKFDIEEL